MPGFAILFILLAVAALCGPIALIIAVINNNRIRELEQRYGIKPQEWRAPVRPVAIRPPVVPVAGPGAQTPKPPPSEAIANTATAERLKEYTGKPRGHEIHAADEAAGTMPVEKFSLEVLLGTKWLAIAGSVAVLVGVIFGLKYLYDNGLIGALGRTLIVAAAGLAAIGIGQWTRVRGYDIVAKSLTALGFALLYAADFAAFGFYHLITTEAAFGLAIIITACGLLYALSLDEVIMAFLSLLGGFLSPFFLSSGENRPGALFGYVTILAVGAMLIGMKRKWRSINVLTFVGTVVLYTAWFEKFYEPTIWQSNPPQLGVAIAWLGVFFAIYLVMPAVHGLVHSKNAQREDVGLVISNAIVTFIFLSRILHGYREYLALAAAVLCAAHLGLMACVHKRAAQDTALKLSLLVIGLFFLTAAIPLYFKMYGTAIAWAGEGAVLAFVAIRYRSIFTQIASLITMTLSVMMLVKELPLHIGAFEPVFNAEFGSWLFAAAAIYAAHWFYRRSETGMVPVMRELSQYLFAASVLVVLCGACMEWYEHMEFNEHNQAAGRMGVIVLLSLFSLVPIIPRIKPRGNVGFAVGTAFSLMTFAAVLIFDMRLYHHGMRFILNWAFATGICAAASLYVAHLLYRIVWKEALGDYAEALAQLLFGTAMILLVYIAAVQYLRHLQIDFIFGVNSQTLFAEGLLVILTGAAIVSMLEKFAPNGPGPIAMAGVFAAIAMVLGITQLREFHPYNFVVFINSGFLFAILPVIALAINGVGAYRRGGEFRTFGYGCGLAILFYVWLLMTEELYFYWNDARHAAVSASSIDKGQMWISILWAFYAAVVMGLGLWRRVVALRYIGFGFFTLVLVKVFLFDMSRLSGVYQIGGFTLLGMVLIGMSYLYQYLRKQGFFDSSRSQQS